MLLIIILIILLAGREVPYHGHVCTQNVKRHLAAGSPT